MIVTNREFKLVLDTLKYMFVKDSTDYELEGKIDSGKLMLTELKEFMQIKGFEYLITINQQVFSEESLEEHN